MSPRPLVLGLTLVTPLLLSGCFLFAPPAPTGPTPEEIAAAEEAREQERLRQIEAARTDFVTRANAAKLAFETTPTNATLFDYYEALQTYYKLPEESQVGIDFDPYLEVIMTGTTPMLEPLLATWANKKDRTLELRQLIKATYSFRIAVLRMRKATPDQYDPDGTTMLSLGPVTAEWTIGGDIDDTDDGMLDLLEEVGGRPAVHTICKAALEKAIAEDKRDVARQHYIMEACAYWKLGAGDWETDLHMWATTKQTKAFVPEYQVYREKRIAEQEADMVRMEAEYRAQQAQEAERDAQSAAAQGGGGGSSSGGSSSGGGESAGPVSVTVRNSCSSGVKFFWGDDPKFGSGRTDSLGSNSRTSTQAKIGQVVWLTDENQNGIASATVSASTREIEFTCGGVSAR